MPFTVIEMVDMALQQAGLDSSFQQLGKGRLKLILEDQQRAFNWPFLRKIAANEYFISGQVAYALPSDYQRSDTLYLTNNGERSGEINLLDQTEFDRLRSTSTEGIPSNAFINTLDQTLVFEMAPGGGPYGFILTYFKSDLNIDVSGSTTNNSVPAFQDQRFLIDRLTQDLYEYLDDQRYADKREETANQLRISKMNVFDTDHNSTVTLASPIFRPGRRPTRGG